ncbi:MAG: hypothetical protein RLY86_101 [Pseudomonadota bacterium]|jgi:hypothetical protein
MRAIYHLRTLPELQTLVGHITNAKLALSAQVAPNTISALRFGRPVTARKAYGVWNAIGQMAKDIGITLPESKGPQRSSHRLVRVEELARRSGKEGLLGLRDKDGYLTDRKLAQAAAGACMTPWFRAVLTQALVEAGVAQMVVDQHFIEEAEDVRIDAIVDESL